MEIEWHTGDVIRKLREARRWNQKRLATAAKMNKATIVSVEENTPGTKRETYEKIARALGLSLGDLFSLIPNPLAAHPEARLYRDASIGVDDKDVIVNESGRVTEIKRRIAAETTPMEDEREKAKKRRG